MKYLKHELLAKKLDFKNYFFVEYLCFNLIGIDFGAEKRILKLPWLTLFGFCGLTAVIATSHYAANHLNDLDVVTDALVTCVQITLSVWKYTIIIYKRNELAKFLRYVWSIEDRASDIELQTIANENKTHWRVSSIYGGTVSITCLMVFITPIFMGTFAYIFRGEFIYKMPLTATYPVNINEPFNYIIAFIWNIFAIHLTVLASIAAESIYSWSIHNIVAQFKIVQEKFKTLSVTKFNGRETGGSNTTVDDNTIETLIAHCINYHQKTLILADNFNRIICPIVFGEFLLSSVQICFLAYKIGRGLDLASMPFLLSALMAVAVQLFLYSYSGQYLENESEKVAIVVYESLQWQFWNYKERKMLLLSILRAQRCCNITGIFFVCNMRLFLWVVQRAASFVTLLWSMRNK